MWPVLWSLLDARRVALGHSSRMLRTTPGADGAPGSTASLHAANRQRVLAVLRASADEATSPGDASPRPSWPAAPGSRAPRSATSSASWPAPSWCDRARQRPPRHLRAAISRTAGLVAGVDFGHSHLSVALGDLTGSRDRRATASASTPRTTTTTALDRAPDAMPWRRSSPSTRATAAAGPPRRPGPPRPVHRRRGAVLRDPAGLGRRRRHAAATECLGLPVDSRERRQPRRPRRAPLRRRAGPHELGLREDLLGRRRRHRRRRRALRGARRHAPARSAT